MEINFPFSPLQDLIYTYEYIDRQSNKVANLILSLGIKKGDVVAMLMFNSVQFIWTALGNFPILI